MQTNHVQVRTTEHVASTSATTEKASVDPCKLYPFISEFIEKTKKYYDIIPQEFFSEHYLPQAKYFSTVPQELENTIMNSKVILKQYRCLNT